MNILNLFNGEKFNYDQITEEMLSGVEFFKFFVSDHLKTLCGLTFLEKQFHLLRSGNMGFGIMSLKCCKTQRIAEVG